MRCIPGTRLILALRVAVLAVPAIASAGRLHAQTPAPPLAVWTSPGAEHLFGFPDVAPHKKGTLAFTANAVTFTGKSETTSIPRRSVTAVSAGNERVEIWGLGGRVLRMVIPEGGGIAAAAVMHHRIDMLGIEFTDDRGGMHDAVFFLPASEAARALESFVQTPAAPKSATAAACRGSLVEPNSVLVAAPDWARSQVPEAYRGLLYEHTIDRLQKTKGVAHVYREGEHFADRMCPQYTIRMSIASFKEGSSVKRASMGPAGMFVATTQMVFDLNITDASGTVNSNEQIRATIRGEVESTNVADKTAKALAKHYDAAIRKRNHVSK